MKKALLTRDLFKELVFKRDKKSCVICRKEAVDAHHLIERKLWKDGGYYLDNGVSLCEECHFKAETNQISPDKLRYFARIEKVMLPENFDISLSYDKWGKVKYPRTPHLPFGKTITDDDEVIKNLNFMNGNTITTLKMDGENTTMYCDYLHSRSITAKSNPYQSYVRSLHASIKRDIPDGWRICGENMWSVHSIEYTQLENYFLVFSIWDNNNDCLSWEETKEYCEILGLSLVPEISKINNLEKLHKLWIDNYDENFNEGYVVRNSESFNLRDFGTNIAKYVRANHLVDSKIDNRNRNNKLWKTEKLTK